MKATVRLAVDLAIADGKFDEFERVARTMTAGTQKEPGAKAYDWYLSADRKRCRLIEAYVDADALLAHFKGSVVQELVPKLLEVTSLSRFEVYGDPGTEAGQMLAGFGAEVFPLYQGLG
jgi:quinol monooxygenase YgiN